METVNTLALHYTILHIEIIIHPFKSSIPLCSFYSKGGGLQSLL